MLCIPFLVRFRCSSSLERVHLRLTHSRHDERIPCTRRGQTCRGEARPCATMPPRRVRRPFETAFPSSEDHLDGVRFRAVRRQEEQLRSGILEQFPGRPNLVNGQIVGNDGITWSRRPVALVYPCRERGSVDGPVREPMTIRSCLGPAMKARVFRFPCGTRATGRRPRELRPESFSS